MSKSRQEKKQRSDWIYARTDGVVDKLVFTYDPRDQTFGLENAEPGSTKLVRSYERASGKDKVIVESVSKTDRATFDSLPFLQANFDYPVAVDTNYGAADSPDIAISVAYHVPKRLSTYHDQIPFNPLIGFVFRGVYPGLNPERLGWWMVIQHCLGSAIAVSSRVGLVVDSELGSLEAINSREKPLIGNEMLPEHIQLLYASDAAADTLQNQMIRYCDRSATDAKPSVLRQTKGIDWSECEYCRGFLIIQGA